MGAFVAGSRALREFLINHARTFIFTTALPPYCAAHLQEALRLAAQSEGARDHLRALGRYMRERMHAAGYDTGRSDSQIIPLVIGSNEAAIRFAADLNAAGFAVRAIRPPTVPYGTSRLRLSLNATLSFSDIDAFVDAILAVREREAVSE
jgi:8-amino-7-oxononanoate synthase